MGAQKRISSKRTQILGDNLMLNFKHALLLGTSIAAAILLQVRPSLADGWRPRRHLVNLQDPSVARVRPSQDWFAGADLVQSARRPSSIPDNACHSSYTCQRNQLIDRVVKLQTLNPSVQTDIATEQPATRSTTTQAQASSWTGSAANLSEGLSRAWHRVASPNASRGVGPGAGGVEHCPQYM